MTGWDSRFEQHDARQLVQRLAALLASIDNANHAHVADQLARADDVVAFIGKTFDMADPQLVSPYLLDPLVSGLREAQTRLEQLVAADTWDELAAVNQSLDVVLGQLGWGATRMPASVGVMREAAKAGRARMVEAVDAIESRVAKADKLIEAVEARAAAADTRVIESATAAEARITSEFAPIEAKIDAVVASADTQVARLDKALTAFQEQFSAAEAARLEQFTKALTRLQDEHIEFMRREETTAAESDKSTSAASSDYLAKLANWEEQARRLVSKTGSGAVGGGYFDYAEQQKRSADIMRLFGIALVAGTVVFGLFSLGTGGVLELDLRWLAGRLLVGVPLVGLAIYCFAQSGKHRDAEEVARKAELDFKALDPYIELLEPEERSKLKAGLAERAFFRSDTGSVDPNLVREVGKLLKDLRGDDK